MNFVCGFARLLAASDLSLADALLHAALCASVATCSVSYLLSMQTVMDLHVQTKQLAEEIISHIREVAGADALVSAFTSAKKAVTAVRSERKRRAAVQVWLFYTDSNCAVLFHGALKCVLIGAVFCHLKSLLDKQ